MGIKREAVESSNIISAGYDAETETMVMEFRTGLYRYTGVPQSEWDSFQAAESKGSHFQRVMRSAFPGERFEEDEDQEEEDGADDGDG